jgi:DNA-binding response OmpR family regulator
MIIIVDERSEVTEAYCASFGREGLSPTGFNQAEFEGWFHTAGVQDLAAVETIIIGSFPDRERSISMVKSRSSIPVIAVNETMGLESMLSLFATGADDVVRKPVHAREFIARIAAIKRRICAAPSQSDFGELKIFFDGRDPEINGQVLMLPRRERRILEYLVVNRMRRVNRSLIFNAVYGLFDDEVEESVVESHISKLRKKLKHALGYDPIDSRRYLGYQLVDRGDVQTACVIQVHVNEEDRDIEPLLSSRGARNPFTKKGNSFTPMLLGEAA